MALLLLGVGILSERFGGGRGLQELGTGVQAIVAAPLTGTGMGLTSFAGGLRDVAETFGDLGRGLSDLFASIPSLPAPREGPPRHGTTNGNGGPPLITMGGGDKSTEQAGGGGNVPKPLLPAPPISGGGPPTLRAPILFGDGTSGGSTTMRPQLV